MQWLHLSLQSLTLCSIGCKRRHKVSFQKSCSAVSMAFCSLLPSLIMRKMSQLKALQLTCSNPLILQMMRLKSQKMEVACSGAQSVVPSLSLSLPFLTSHGSLLFALLYLLPLSIKSSVCIASRISFRFMIAKLKSPTHVSLQSCYPVLLTVSWMFH